MAPTNIAGHNSINCHVVTTYEQLLHANIVRGICYIEEKQFLADVAFDGNDWQSTHIIVYDGKEPIGTCRVRWFQDFAHFERTCFRKGWRNPFVVKACANFVFEHVARKGFKRVITHAEPRYAALWMKLLGFKRVDKEPLSIRGQAEPFYELVKELDAVEPTVDMNTSPEVIWQVEGHWEFTDDHAG